MLASLAGCADLGEHARNLADRGRHAGSDGVIHEGLRILVKEGLLRPKSAFLADIMDAPPPSHAEANLSTVAWITRDRPRALQRGMESLIKNLPAQSAVSRFLIMDDSNRDPADSEVIPRAAELAKRHGIRVDYAGLPEKRAFHDRLRIELKQAGVPGTVIEFALFGTPELVGTIGANRNALLLATRGELIMSSDDDMVFDRYQLADVETELVLAGNAKVPNVRYFPDRQDLLSHCAPLPGDTVADHKRLLGKSVAACLAQLRNQGRVRLQNPHDRFQQEICSPSARVVATAMGYYGDSGMPNPQSVLLAEGPVRESVLRDERTYARALRSREILHMVSRPVISRQTVISAGNIGLDNRTLLPPFFPVLRGEDTIFSAVLNLCVDHGFIGLLPQAVAHFPEEPRLYPENALFSAAPLFSESFLLLLHQFAPFPGTRTPQQRLFELGTYLETIATLADADFQHLLRLNGLARFEQNQTRLERLLVRYNSSPSYWAKDVRKVLETRREQAQNAPHLLPEELLSRRTEPEALSLFKKLIKNYSELLIFWPTIVDQVEALQKQGITLPRTLG